MKTLIENKPKNRCGNPSWKKGVSGNPNGRPTVAEIDKLREAIEEGEKKFGVSIFNHAINRAFKNDIVLVALLKKIVPDKLEGKGFGDTYILTHIKGILQDGLMRASGDRPTTSQESNTIVAK